MGAIFQIIVQYVAEILGLVIVTAIGVLGTYILSKMNKSQKLKNIAAATEIVVAATQETVRRLQQTLVEGYKEAAVDGKLTQAQIHELNTQLLQITLAHLGQPTLDLLTAAKIDVSSLITNAGEAFINQLKADAEAE